MEKLEDVLKDFNFYNDFFYDSALEEELIKKISEKGLSFSFGATKFVFYSDDSDYVVKIPYNATVECCEIINFTGATGDYNDEAWDYCAQEVKIYEQAEADGMSYAFAKIKWVMDVDDWPIYTQEKCYGIHQMPQNLFSEVESSKEKVIKTCKDKDLDFLDARWTTAFYNCYGEDALIDLLGYIEDMDISDLHHNNLGFTKVGNKPVIIDYGGYRE